MAWGSRAGWGGGRGFGGMVLVLSVEPGEPARVPTRSALVGLRPSLLNAGRLGWQGRRPGDLRGQFWGSQRGDP